MAKLIDVLPEGLRIIRQVNFYHDRALKASILNGLPLLNGLMKESSRPVGLEA